MKINNSLSYLKLASIIIAINLIIIPDLNARQDQFKLYAYTRQPDNYVMLTWTPEDDIQKYNIYRKEDLNAVYPNTPTNSSPIESMSDCDDFKMLIPEDSKDWKIICSTFTTSSSVFDPCQLYTINAEHAQYGLLEVLVRARWRIAVAAGLAYEDFDVTYGKEYYYKIVGVKAGGNETRALDTDVKIKAGYPDIPPIPINIKIFPGDAQVMLIWDSLENVNAYDIYRSRFLSGGYRPINDIPSSSRYRFDFNREPFTPDSSWFPGFVDYQRWDSTTGQPIPHDVRGILIDGPLNGTRYYYMVQSVDFIGNRSDFSGFYTTIPEDKTPPKSPVDVIIVADEPNSKLEIHWSLVEMDIVNHVEVQGIKGYYVFRYEESYDPAVGAIQVGGIVVPPATDITAMAVDGWSGLRSSYGDKTYYYRVEAVDMAGNRSSRSAAGGGFLKDITPPAPPDNVFGEGFENYIRVSWYLNTEPDIDGYNIYRSLCDRGEWVECMEPFMIVCEDTVQLLEDSLPCSGPFMLIGYLNQEDAEGLLTDSVVQPYFDDYTVPAGSPLCYAYLIKAVDKSQNTSGKWPLPEIPTEEIICQRLRDRTPPEPAYISKLLARDNSILVEWIGAPVQDIRAYHVYRAENENGPYDWAGGMNAEIPPTPGIALAQAYELSPEFEVDCTEIPINNFEDMSTGQFLDTEVYPKEIYWYKVVGIDWRGNESDLTNAVPVSTFTFSTELAAEPVITSVTRSNAPCGLLIQWEPVFDNMKMKGFALYRKDIVDGEYHQIGFLDQANSYLDSAVVQGKRYWYRVLQIDFGGNPSQLSNSESAIY